MNDDGRLVGALVQGNEAILHHAPETPAYSSTVETLASAAVLSKHATKDCDVAIAAATAVCV